MKKITVFFALVVPALMALSLTTAHADELTPAKREQIKALLEITHVRAIPETIANNTVQSWAAGIKKADPKFPDKGFTVMRDAFLAGLNAKADAPGGMIEQVSLVYHNNFSAAEVSELLKFYQSATGKKLLASQSKVNGESFQAAMKWAETLSGDIDARIDAALKKENIKAPTPPPQPAQSKAPAAPAAGAKK